MARKSAGKSLVLDIQKGIKGIFSAELEMSDYEEFTPHVRRAIGHKDNLLDCAKRFGTPLYVLDEGMLAGQTHRIIMEFGKHLPKVSVFYAFKSNDLPYLLQKLKDLGVNADVSSMFELQLALKLGFKRIIFTAPVKSDGELKFVLEHSDRVVLNVDNLDELERIVRLAGWRQPKKPLKVCFRLNPLGSGGAWPKFGLSLDDFRIAAGVVMENKSLKWAGVHFHSSWNQTPDAHVENIRLISRFLRANFNIAELSSIEFIDIGGGYLPEGTGALFSASTRGKIIEKTIERHEKLPELREVFREVYREKQADISEFASRIGFTLRQELIGPLARDDLEVWLEPGRFISSQSTYILLGVASAGKGRVMVDGGINLIGGANFEFEFYPVINLSRPSIKRRKATIYGPLCDPEDHWGFSYFGDPCQKGDILAVMNQGAYTFSTAWRWQRPTAAYAAFSGNRITLAKQEETFDQRYAGCRF